ncbi:hypothetical protein JCM8097_009488 [Rhodosporidiobolus ruineniae]
MSLPIIDLSPFLLPTSSPNSRLATAQAVHDACTRFGFFYITGFNTVVSPAELDQSLQLARLFFQRPQEEKDSLKIRPGDGARGYQRLGENKTRDLPDAHEGWDAYHPVPPEEEDASRLLQGPNLWPEQPGEFRPFFERWVEKMHVLGTALMEATAVGLGIDLEKDETGEWARLKKWVDDPFWVMRCIGYPPLPADAKGVSCGEHKDYGNFTILHADSTLGALQVFLHDPSGPSIESGQRGRWLNADPIPNTFVVNIGEMVEVYSAGLYKATLHRVLHKGSSYRVSIPFFYEPSFNAVIEPLPSAVRLREALPDASSLAPLPKPQHYGRFLESKVSNNFYSSP